MGRSHEFEASWLASVSDKAGSREAEPFVEAVWRRLRKGADEYGGDDAFIERSFDELVGEAREEGEDFPGWLVLAVQRLRREGRVSAEVSRHIERILIEASAKVVEGWHLVGLALELYAEETEDRPK